MVVPSLDPGKRSLAQTMCLKEHCTLDWHSSKCSKCPSKGNNAILVGSQVHTRPHLLARNFYLEIFQILLQWLEPSRARSAIWAGRPSPRQSHPLWASFSISSPWRILQLSLTSAPLTYVWGRPDVLRSSRTHSMASSWCFMTSSGSRIAWRGIHYY